MWLLLVFAVLTNTFISAQLITPQNHKTGVVFLSDSDYAKLPRPNWNILRKYALRSLSSSQTTGGIVMLNTPPVGDQGTEGSCVGWAVGYTALGILMYPKYNNWNSARRSPNYVYDQIKSSSSCTSNANMKDALNLVCNQGDCSWNSMSYIDGDCSVLPDTAQQNEAIQNKALSWAALNVTDLADIKQAINLGYPVIIGFEVYQSFYDMFNTGNGIWNTNYGTYWGNHATCIIGYDDNKAMVKVQNQWGAINGDQGFFWIPYSFIESGCLKEAYILYATNPLTPMSFSGPNTLCTSGTYTLANLPSEATLSWNSSPGLSLSSTSNNTATFTANGNDSSWVQPIINGVNLSKYWVWVGMPMAVTEIEGFFSQTFSPNSEYAFGLQPNLSWNEYNWTVRGGSILSGQGTDNIEVETNNVTGTKTFNVSVQVGNNCGWSAWFTKSGIIDGGLGPLVIFPNPASDLVQVSLNAISETTSDNILTNGSVVSPTSYDVKILDSYGSTVFETTKSEKKFNLPISFLHNGIYTVIVSNGKMTYQKKLIVRH